MGVPGAKLAVTKIALDLIDVSQISAAHRPTHFFIRLFKTMVSTAMNAQVTMSY